jgi:hypothetical protein
MPMARRATSQVPARRATNRAAALAAAFVVCAVGSPAQAAIPAAAMAAAQVAAPRTEESQQLRSRILSMPAQIVAPGAPPVAAVAAPAASAAVLPALRAGMLAHVVVPPAEEQVVTKALVARLALTAPTKTVTAFQGVLRQLDSRGEEVQLKPYVLVGDPMKYDARTGSFDGSISVGVVDVIDNIEQRPLSAPVIFQVRESSMADPSIVTLTATSPPTSAIRLQTKTVGAGAVVHVVSRFDPSGVEVTVPVEPTLLLRSDRDDLQAYGLQVAHITIMAAGVTPPIHAAVTLSAPNAFIEPSSIVTLSDTGTAQVTVRSDGPGIVHVSALAVSSGFAVGNDVTLTVSTPARTLLATVIGGLAGGLLRLGPQLRKGMKAGRFAFGLLLAVLTGVLVFALYVLGVKLVPVEFSVQTGMLFAAAVSALGAWLGTGILPQLKSGTA